MSSSRPFAFVGSLFFALFSITQAIGAPNYEPEKARLRQAIRRSAVETERVAGMLRNAHEDLLKIRIELEVLALSVDSALTIEPSPSSSTPSSPSNLDPEVVKLLTHQVKTQSVVRELEQRIPFLRERVRKLRVSFGEFSEGVVLSQEIETEINVLERTVLIPARSRLEEIRSRIGEAQQAAVEVEIERFYDERERSLRNQEQVSLLSRWSSDLTLLRHAALVEMYGGNFTAAKLTLDSLEWALENSLVYLQGIPFTTENQAVLKAREAELRAKFKEVYELYERGLLEQRLGPMRSTLLALSPADSSDLPISAEDIVNSDDYQDEVEAASNLPEGGSSSSSGESVTLKGAHGENLSFDRQVVSEKTVCEYSEQSGRREAEVSIHYGISRMEDGKVAENLRIPESLEFGALGAETIKEEFQNFNFEVRQSFKVTCPELPPETQEKAREAERFPREAAQMLERAIEDSRSRQEKSDLQELKKLTDQLGKLQQEFKTLVNRYTEKMSSNSNRILNTLRGWQTKAKSALAAPLPRVDASALKKRNADRRRDYRNRNALVWAEAMGVGLTELTQGLWDHLDRQGRAGTARDQVLSARARKRERLPKKPPGSLVSSGRPLNESARDAILEFARKALDRKIRYVSDDTPARLGPDSYDCSGFVGKAYEAAGLGYTTYSGGIPNVEALLQDTEVFERIDLDQARPGDLVVHLGIPRKTPNHVGIFTRSSGESIFEVSALTRNGDANRDFEHPDFKTSVVEHPASWIGSPSFILRWKK